MIKDVGKKYRERKNHVVLYTSTFICSTGAAVGSLLASFSLSASCNRKPTDSDSCHHYPETALLQYSLTTAAPEHQLKTTVATEGRAGQQSYFNDTNSVLLNEDRGEFCKFLSL